MEKILVALRECVLLHSRNDGLADGANRHMAHPNNKKLPQPPEGTTY